MVPDAPAGNNMRAGFQPAKSVAGAGAILNPPNLNDWVVREAASGSRPLAVNRHPARDAGGVDPPGGD